MGKFIWGIIVGVLGVAAGAYIYVHYGFMNMQADRTPGRIESMYMGSAMDHYAERHAPRVQNPIQLTEANLVDGVRLYKSNCAVCHGGPDKPISNVGLGFNPPVPQFLKEAPDMPENENYWIIRHGIKMTGMPAWDKVLSDTDIWKVTTFLSMMGGLDKLPPAAQAEWKAGGQVELGAQQNPSAPGPQPGAATATPSHPEKHGHDHSH
jgi:thiosulfate dehydrogenase